MTGHPFNQSAEGAGGLGIIRGNKVGESEQVCTVIITTKNIKKSCVSRDSNPGYMGSKSTKISSTL